MSAVQGQSYKKIALKTGFLQKQNGGRTIQKLRSLWRVSPGENCINVTIDIEIPVEK